MATLRDTERKEIVQRLACFETPSEVATWASQAFEKDITTEQVCHYDPSRSDDTAEKWVQLFRETRDEFLGDLDTIALSHRAVRLRELDDLYRAAKAAGDFAEAASMLKQAAKEVGHKFTNEKRLEHSGRDGAPIEVIFDDDVPDPDGADDD